MSRKVFISIYGSIININHTFPLWLSDDKSGENSPLYLIICYSQGMTFPVIHLISPLSNSPNTLLTSSEVVWSVRWPLPVMKVTQDYFDMTGRGPKIDL